MQLYEKVNEIFVSISLEYIITIFHTSNLCSLLYLILINQIEINQTNCMS